ncbi:MAG: ribonuclease J [Chloroflexi bacterium]|nr:ribonuclease J [Chloroflexota bacterium]
MADVIRIIPLGGVGEIGKNCIVVEYGDDLLVVDAGLKFPDAEMFGIDLVIPDVTYLRERRDQVRAILITHGHEDHIGALPYILPHLDVPIYAPRLAHGFITAKLREHRLLEQSDLHVVEPDQVYTLGSFLVQPFRVTHSIPDAVGYAIHTPVGTVVHTGDFKFDPTPVYGPPPDIRLIRAIGDRGVLALLSDCTRIEHPGFTPSEQLVGTTFDEIIRDLTGRVIITSFASNISRIQQALDVAGRYGRKVALVGRSMAQNTTVATELGILRPPDSTIVRLEEMRRLPPNQIMLLTTGSQGEPAAALSRIANGDHRQIRITPGDTVIFSAAPIPGNEESVARTIDNLLRLGADVVYEALATVHVSGHGSRDDLKLMLDLLRPRYCIPIHGEYRHLVLYRKMAIEAGLRPEHIALLEIGDVVAVDADAIQRVERVVSGQVLVDGFSVGGTLDVVLRDRQHLSRDGVMIVVVTMDRSTGELLAGPDIVTRGLSLTPGNNGDLIESARLRVREAVVNHATEIDHAFLSHKIKDSVGDYVYRQTRNHPLILPVVTEV